MAQSVIVGALLFSACGALVWDEWKVKFTKSYASVHHEQTAKLRWEANLKLVEAHNSRYNLGEVTFKLGMNSLADLSNAEYRARYLRSPRAATWASQAVGTFESLSANDVPDSWNWVDHGVITNVKDQGNCGSCWAFSAVVAMEGAFNQKMANGTFPSQCLAKCGKNQTKQCCSFSEQEVADCTNNGADTCDVGGEPHDGIMEIVNRKGLINTEDQYPYSSGKTGALSKCSPVGNGVQLGLKGYMNISSGDETALTQATYKHAGISVGIDASSFAFQLYDSGVYVDNACKNGPNDLDHGVAVVGYGIGAPQPPGPPTPAPGPANCDQNYYKPECLKEKGCFWCVDSHNLGYCMNTPCSSSAKGGTTERATVTDLEWYMVKNSWSTGWGMSGYIAMARNHNNMCGIATDAVFVV